MRCPGPLGVRLLFWPKRWSASLPRVTACFSRHLDHQESISEGSWTLSPDWGALGGGGSGIRRGGDPAGAGGCSETLQNKLPRGAAPRGSRPTPVLNPSPSRPQGGARGPRCEPLGALRQKLERGLVTWARAGWYCSGCTQEPRGLWKELPRAGLLSPTAGGAKEIS